jgi:hypothetical protein
VASGYPRWRGPSGLRYCIRQGPGCLRGQPGWAPAVGHRKAWVAGRVSSASAGVVRVARRQDARRQEPWVPWWHAQSRQVGHLWRRGLLPPQCIVRCCLRCCCWRAAKPGAAGGAAALACRQNAQRRLLRKGGHPILLLRHHTWDGTGAQVVLRQRLATAIRCGCCGLRHRSDWGDARDKGISLVLCCSLRHRPLTMLVDGGCMLLSVRLRWIVCS